MMDLTPQQERSLDVSTHLAVTAGAGSGKTRVLVERYLSILELDDNVSPRNILALTFTEKASAEMKERVRIGIQEKFNDTSHLGWERKLSELEGADISTIHSFCTGLIRKEPIHCGVDPDFHVITGGEEVYLRREAMKELFTRRSSCSEPLRRLLVDHGSRNVRSMLNFLMREKIRLPEPLSGEVAMERAGTFWDLALSELRERALADVDGVGSAVSVLSDLPVPRDKKDPAVRMLDSLSPLLEWFASSGSNATDPSTFLARIGKSLGALLTKKGVGRSTKRMGSSKVWGDDLERFRENINVLISFAHDHRGVIGFLGRNDLVQRGKERLLDLMEVYSVYEGIYQRSKLRENGLDLDDLITTALQLLKDDRDGLVARLRTRYRYLLIDEFQDTDPRQWRMIEILWGDGKECNLFIVGDPKQSIYGFRSADVRLFNRAKGLLEGMDDGDVVSLDMNFRSRSEIMELVNLLFPEIFQEGSGGWNVEFHPLDPHRAGGGKISFIGVVDKPSPELREGIAVARTIKRAVREGWPVGEEDRPLEVGDVAILIPARTGLRFYEEALRRENVPYQVYKGKGFFERQEIFDVFQMVRFLAHPHDDVALASVLKGPIFRLSDDDLMRVSLSDGPTFREKLSKTAEFENVSGELERYINYGRSLPPHSSLYRILVESGMYAAVGGSRGGNNIDKLVELVSSEMDGVDMEEVAANLGRLLDEAPTEGEADPGAGNDKVTIMTVHASKGLEWPMVCVMGMHHEMALFGRSGVALHPERGVSMKAYDPSDGSLVDPPSWILTRDEVREMEHQERKRLFYVACTRGRDHLVMSGKLPDPPLDGKNPSRSLMDLLLGSFELEMEDMEEGKKSLQGLDITLQLVDKEILPSELEGEDEGEVDLETGHVRGGPTGEELKIEVDLSEITVRSHRHLLSPTSHEVILSDKSSGVGADRNLSRLGRGLPRMYPSFSDELSPDVRGSVIHEIMEGKDPRRVCREHGCEDHMDALLESCSDLNKQRSKLGKGVLFTEAEFVRLHEIDGEKLPVTGMIDLVLVREDGSAVVVDYKTGRFDEKWAIQMSIYREAVQSMSGPDVSTEILRTDG
ncbi:MAG: UvrD-helicase domain-containing protein [Thermoplasmata archaeon]|nr:UvrD-helicase domain-containing protein [Thermoplasmata archaeon]